MNSFFLECWVLKNDVYRIHCGIKCNYIPVLSDIVIEFLFFDDCLSFSLFFNS